VCVKESVCACVRMKEPRGKSKHTTCTKYTIFIVKPSSTWLPLNLKKSNIRIGIATRYFLNVFSRSKTKHSTSFIRLFRLREHYPFLPVLVIAFFP
jgi:hypothetical protein